MQAATGRPIAEIHKCHERLAVPLVCTQSRSWPTRILWGLCIYKTWQCRLKWQGGQETLYFWTRHFEKNKIERLLYFSALWPFIGNSLPTAAASAIFLAFAYLTVFLISPAVEVLDAFSVPSVWTTKHWETTVNWCSFYRLSFGMRHAFSCDWSIVESCLLWRRKCPCSSRAGLFVARPKYSSESLAERFDEVRVRGTPMKNTASERYTVWSRREFVTLLQ